MNRNPALLTATLLCTFALTACGGSTHSEPKASPTTKDVPAKYASAEALRDAVVAAGIPCEDWTHTPSRPGSYKTAADWGWCGEDGDPMISTYASDADLAQALAANRAFAEGVREIKEDADITPVLVGPNWMVETDQGIDTLNEKLGGVIQK